MRSGLILAAGVCLAAGNAAMAQWVTFADETQARLDLTTVSMNDNQEKDMATADFNNDGWTDIIVVRKLPFSHAGARQDVLLMNEEGVLTDRTQQYAPGFMLDLTDARDVACADFDGDGWIDIVIGTTFNDDPKYYRNMGEDKNGVWLGFIDESGPRLVDNIGVNATPFKMCSVGAGDLTGDGRPDLYFSSYEGPDDCLMYNDGNGFFTDVSDEIYPFTETAFGVRNQIRDMDNDGDNDIVKVTTLSNAPFFGDTGVFILWNQGAGVFDPPDGYDEVPNTDSPYMMDTVDLNGDGTLDIYVVQDPQDGYYHVTVNGPQNLSYQHFSPSPSPRTIDFGGNIDHVDIDNDGDMDVYLTPVDVDIANCGGNSEMALLRNDGAGHLSDPYGSDQNFHLSAHDAVHLDVNRDGCMDLFLGLCTGWRVLIQTNGNCEPDCIADFNGDGTLNILDFVVFQDAFVAGDDSADVNGDGTLNILDFITFQDLFVAGC